MRDASATHSCSRSDGPRPGERVDALGNLERVPDGTPERHVHAVSIASVFSPTRAPIATIASASRRASASVFMNAPRPTFTSSTSTSVPSAIFLLMIDDAMSGTLSIVPVTSRSA